MSLIRGLAAWEGIPVALREALVLTYFQHADKDQGHVGADNDG